MIPCKPDRFLCFLSIIALSWSSALYLGCDLDSDDDDADADGLTWIEGTSGVDSTFYYVSTTGDDENDGTSQASAFRSIKKAFQSVKAGGTIRVLPGTYFEGLGLQDLGNASASIRLVGFRGIPVFDGEDERTMGIFAEECHNLIFDSLQFQNYTDIGLGISYCNDVVIRDLVIRDNGHAVQLREWELEGYGIHVENSEDVLITRCDVSGNGPNPQIFPDFLMGTGINTYGNRRVRILDNRSYENTGGGILVEDSYDVLVDSNVCINNDCDASVDEWWDGGIWVDGGADVTVRANVFEGNLGCGIEISDEDLQYPTGYVLENNISTGNYFGIYVWGFGTTDWPDSTILRLSGNQFTGNSRLDVWIQE